MKEEKVTFRTKTENPAKWQQTRSYLLSLCPHSVVVAAPFERATTVSPNITVTQSEEEERRLFGTNNGIGEGGRYRMGKSQSRFPVLFPNDHQWHNYSDSWTHDFGGTMHCTTNAIGGVRLVLVMVVFEGRTTCQLRTGLWKR